MDMYGGKPPRFYMRGMQGTERHADHRADIWSYFYRGILAFAVSAKAFGDEELFRSIRDYSENFARLTGKDFLSNEWQ
jgi:hypothetical protein